MKRQKKESERLPQVVFSADVCIFVRYDVYHILPAHIERQINPRLEDPEHKGGYYALALIDVIMAEHSGADPALYTDEADRCVDQQSGDAREPHRCQYGYPHLQGICAVARIGRERAAHDRIDRVVEDRYSRIEGRRAVRHNARAHDLSARYQADGALDRERTDETQRRDTPQKYPDPLRCLAEEQTEEQYGKQDIARRYAHIEYL